MSVPPHIPDERWHLGGLLSIRTTAGDTNGALSVVEERAVRGYGTPPHVHGREDETLFVIEGELTYVVGGTPGTAVAGSAVFLPRSLPHRFEVTSEEAHFLVIITPGGFEQFFTEVSPSAGAARIPTAEDNAHTGLVQMVRKAAGYGTKVCYDTENIVLAAARTVAESTDRGEIGQAYRGLGAALAGPAPLPPVLDEVAELLAGAVGRLGSDRQHARALILLGILIERAGQKVSFPQLIEAVRPGLGEAEALAFAYALAHFPDHAETVGAAMESVGLSQPDRERLARCLQKPGPEMVNRIGRVWPSPTVWQLDETEQEVDEAWRARLELGEDAVRQLWEAETVALLAFMGAKADHAVERAIGNA
jgi:quercetin dioxygenase-like cupin family protein